jgi:hypothetical protein
MYRVINNIVAHDNGLIITRGKEDAVRESSYRNDNHYERDYS